MSTVGPVCTNFLLFALLLSGGGEAADDFTTRDIVEVVKVKVSFPLTDEDFARADAIDEERLARIYPTTGGPMPAIADLAVHQQLRGVSAIWAGGKIPYTISSGFTSIDRAMIAKAVADLEKNTCLRFSPAEDATATPRMDFVAENLGGFCYTTWSWGGGSNTQATVRLSPRSACTLPRTIIHEILHGLAMYHTHTRSDRDENVEILKDNVDPSMRREFEPCTGCCCDTFGLRYDCESVMHYASDQFSYNSKDTIVSKKSDCKLLKFKDWNLRKPYLSAGDRAAVDMQYGGFC